MLSVSYSRTSSTFLTIYCRLLRHWTLNVQRFANSLPRIWSTNQTGLCAERRATLQWKLLLHSFNTPYLPFGFLVAVLTTIWLRSEANSPIYDRPCPSVTITGDMLATIMDSDSSTRTKSGKIVERRDQVLNWTTIFFLLPQPLPFSTNEVDKKDLFLVNVAQSFLYYLVRRRT